MVRNVTAVFSRPMPILVVLALIVTACGTDPGASAAPSQAPDSVEQASSEPIGGDPIVIGFAYAESGFMQVFDQASLVGASLAVDDLNAQGGVEGRELQIITCDTRTDQAQAAQCGIDLIEQGATLIVASCDFDFGGPAAVQAQQADLIALGCVGSPKFGGQGIGPNAFNVGNATPGEGANAAEWAYDRGWRSAYLLADNFLDYTQEVNKSFKTRWIQLAGEGAIAGEDSFLNGDPSIAAQVSRISGLSEPPDFIWLPSCPPGGASAVRQIRAAGIEVPVLGDTCMDGEYWLEAIPDLENFYNNTYVCVDGTDPRAEVNEFYARFDDETGGEFSPSAKFGAVGYAIVQVVAEAVSQAGSTDTDDLRDALENFTAVPTMLGPTTFTSEYHFDSSRPLMFEEVVDGQKQCLDYWETQEPVEPDF